MKKSVWGKQLYGGYAGLKYTAARISQFIPQCKIYVEPFAGLGSVAKHVKADKMILNDMSDYSINYLNKHFSNAVITKQDFVDCISQTDSINTFFLIDPPYRSAHYENNGLAFADRTEREYYMKLLELVDIMKGDWIICSDSTRTGQLFKKTKWYNAEVTSPKNSIFGKKSRILLTSNNQLKIKVPTMESFV